MTIASISAVQSRASALQETIDALSPAAATTTSTTRTAGTDFASTLSALTGTQASTASPSTADPDLDTLMNAAVEPGTGLAFLQAALKYQGTPYVWGGSTAEGMDCSGLVQRAFADIGVSVPRVAADQAQEGTAVSSLDEARPGDLLVFDGGTHIGIYVGENQMLHAPVPGDHVRVGEIYETPTSIRRVLPTGSVISSGTTGSAAPATLAAADLSMASAVLMGRGAGATSVSSSDRISALSGALGANTSGTSSSLLASLIGGAA